MSVRNGKLSGQESKIADCTKILSVKNMYKVAAVVAEFKFFQYFYFSTLMPKYQFKVLHPPQH